METIFTILMGLAFVTGIFALVAVAFVVGGIAWGIRRAVYAIRGDEYKPLLGGKVKGTYEHQDVDAGSTADSISAVLRRYNRADTIGKYAHAGLAALDSEKRKSTSFYAVLDSTFPQNSLSWGKFSVAAESTHDAVLRNCAEIANRVQVFDPEEYRTIERAYRNASYKRDATPDDMQIQKHQMLHASLAELDAIVASNDKLLLELDKLSAELGKIDSDDSAAASDRIVDEIRTLIDETKYYSQ